MLTLQSHMKPELPEDLALHFHISSVYLVLTVLTIAQTAKRPSSVVSHTHAALSVTQIHNTLCLLCSLTVRKVLPANLTVSGLEPHCEYASRHNNFVLYVLIYLCTIVLCFTTVNMELAHMKLSTNYK